PWGSPAEADLHREQHGRAAQDRAENAAPPPEIRRGDEHRVDARVSPGREQSSVRQHDLGRDHGHERRDRRVAQALQRPRGQLDLAIGGEEEAARQHRHDGETRYSDADVPLRHQTRSGAASGNLRSSSKPTATPAAIPTTMLSLSGKPNAATAAHAATAAAIQLLRSESSEYVTPSNARTPAKPSPHCVGIWSARTMPTSEAPCQLTQFHSAPPQKYGNCSGAGRGSGKRRAK